MAYPFDLGYPPPEAPINLYALPLSVVAKDTLLFRRRFTLYRPSAGWSLHYSLRGVAGSKPDFDATTDGEDFLVQQPADWPHGRYSLQGYVTKASERHTVDLAWLD